MYKRTLNSIRMEDIPDATCMCKSQFGNAMYSCDVAFAITTRIDASGAYCIIEKKEMENNEPKIAAMRGRDKTNPSHRGKANENYEQRIEVNKDGISNTLTTVQKDNLVIEPLALGYTRDKKGNVTDRHLNEVANTIHSSTGSGGNTDCFVAEPINDSLLIKQATSKGYAEVQVGGVFDGSYPNSKTRRGRVQGNGTISPTLTAGGEPPMRFERVGFRGHEYHEGEGLYLHNSIQEDGLKDMSRCLKASKHDAAVVENYRIRKLTPRECFRLMGVSEENIDKIQAAGISKTQQYKMAGNSIVVDVLFHIFRKLFIEKEDDSGQLTLF